MEFNKFIENLNKEKSIAKDDYNKVSVRENDKTTQDGVGKIVFEPNNDLENFKKGLEVEIDDEINIISGEIFGLKINSQEEINDFNAHNAPNYSYEMK